MTTAASTLKQQKNTRKTPPVGNTTSKRKTTKSVTIKKDVTKTEESKSSRESREARKKAPRTLSTAQLTQRVVELETTLNSLIKVLNEEFRAEMLQGPRGVSKSMSKAGLLKDI